MNDFKIRIENFLKSLEASNEVSQTYYINIERFFKNQLIPYCEQTNKIVENFTVEDMIDFMSHSKLALKIRSFENNCVYLRKYIRWCEQNNYVSEEFLNTYFAFTPNIISNIFNNNQYARAISSRKYFISTEEFVKFVNLIFGEELSERVDLIRDVSRFDSQKAILYLLWLGFPAEKIITLTNDDFNIKDKTIAGVKIENKDIFSFFHYYKPRTDFLQLRKKGDEYHAEYQDVFHLVKGIYNECNLITVRNATLTAKKRQKLLADDNKFKHITVNASTIFYSQLFEKCYKKECELISTSSLSKKMLESQLKDIIREYIEAANEADFSKALKEYKLYKSMLDL